MLQASFVFSRKPTATQQRCAETELELLATVETLEEFQGMLWGLRQQCVPNTKNLPLQKKKYS